MLNHEGWCLLGILSALIALMLLALPHMRAERSAQARLISHDGIMGTALGTVLRTCGAMVLAVVPAAVYQGGTVRLGLPVFCAVGVAVLFCLLVPRIKARCPHAMTLCEAVARDAWTRAGLGTVTAIAALISAAAAVSMVARMFAYVFSLHYMIALGAVVGLTFALTLLCGVRARRRMDGLQFLLLMALLIGTPVAALVLSGDAAQAVQFLTQTVAQDADAAMDILVDACAGIGMLGLMLPAQHLFSGQKPAAMRKGGILAAAGVAVLLLLSALGGVAARSVGIKLETIPAAETALTQIAELTALPNPLSAVFNAALVTTLLLYAQAALHFVGMTVAWDVVQPLTHQDKERPLVIAADWVAPLACAFTFLLARNPNTPLAWYVRDVLLLGAVMGSFLLARAFGAKPGRLARRIGLVAGVAVVLILWLLPLPEKYKLLGAIPAMLFALLPQLLIIDFTPKR